MKKERFRDNKGRFISPERYVNEFLPDRITDFDARDEETGRILSMFNLSFDEEREEFFRPLKLSGSLKNKRFAEKEPETVNELFTELWEDTASVPYWELTGLVSKLGEGMKINIFRNEKKMISTRDQNKAISRAQDYVRDMNKTLDNMKKAQNTKNVGLYSIAFYILTGDTLDIHIIEDDEIELSEFTY